MSHKGKRGGRCGDDKAYTWLQVRAKYTNEGSSGTIQESEIYARSCEPIQACANYRKRPFHGGNTGSNPVGDASKINGLLESGVFGEGLKGFDKKDSLAGRLFFPCLLAARESF
jgi:hypothetical protein